ncbi:hypothetical protein DFJ73DRAFT_220402 [Zopfochytrium polystomum]|nr:hypothetical protein DFJ73DRAFT_220402 [Zopfochytrium polystomum]
MPAQSQQQQARSVRRLSVPNSEFNPKPTTTARCPHLKLSVVLKPTEPGKGRVSTAGGYVKGIMILECTNPLIWLSDIHVDLDGSEDVRDSATGESKSEKIVSQVQWFQRPGMPPSPGAVTGAPRDGFWQAKATTTQFPFQFQLPETAPTSFAFRKDAEVKYLVTGFVKFMDGSTVDVIFKSTEATVVEKLHPKDVEKATESGPVEVKVAGSGVSLTVRIKRSFFRVEKSIGVSVSIDNRSRTRISGVRVSLLRKLLLANGAESGVKAIEDMSESYSEFPVEVDSSRDFCVSPGIPVTTKTVKMTSRCFVSVLLRVSLMTNSLSRIDLAANLPIEVFHTYSVRASLTDSVRENFLKKSHSAPVGDRTGMLSRFETTRISHGEAFGRSVASPSASLDASSSDDIEYQPPNRRRERGRSLCAPSTRRRDDILAAAVSEDSTSTWGEIHYHGLGFVDNTVPCGGYASQQQPAPAYCPSVFDGQFCNDAYCCSAGYYVDPQGALHQYHPGYHYAYPSPQTQLFHQQLERHQKQETQRQVKQARPLPPRPIIATSDEGLQNRTPPPIPPRPKNYAKNMAADKAKSDPKLRQRSMSHGRAAAGAGHAARKNCC